MDYIDCRTPWSVLIANGRFFEENYRRVRSQNLIQNFPRTRKIRVQRLFEQRKYTSESIIAMDETAIWADTV